MPTADYVRDRIQQALPDAHVEVIDTTGTGDHFQALIVSPAFEGRTRIDQHRMVYAAVESELADGSIHALSLRTRVPEGA